jgi:hypothetical protein
VNIRLHGTKGECEVASFLLQRAFHVVSITEPYPDRGQSILCRVYVEVRIPEGTTNAAAVFKGIEPAGEGQ